MKIDQANHIIRRVPIRTGRFSPAAVRQVARRFENAVVICDGDDGPPRVDQACGAIRAVRYEQGALVADWHFLPSHVHTPKLLENYERKLNFFGLQLVGRGNNPQRVEIVVLPRESRSTAARREQAPSNDRAKNDLAGYFRPETQGRKFLDRFFKR